MLLSPDYIKIVLEKYSDLKKNHKGTFHNAPSLSNAYITDMLQEIINSGITVYPVITNGKWCEIDTVEDLEIANNLFK